MNHDFADLQGGTVDAVLSQDHAVGLFRLGRS